MNLEIGNKIFELRKINHLSQEQLAEKLEVVRQTISKQELGETTPDLKQAKALAKIFKISLDELVDNDLKEILVEKSIIIEKRINKTTKNLKILFVMIYLILLIFFLFIIIHFLSKKDFTKEYQTELLCVIDNEKYNIFIDLDEDNMYYIWIYNINGVLENKHLAGSTLPEAALTLKYVKGVALYEGGVCR